MGITIIIGYFLIYQLGTIGAAFAASIVYVLQTIYQLAMLKRSTEVQYKDLLLGKEDFKTMIEIVKEKLGKN